MKKLKRIGIYIGTVLAIVLFFAVFAHAFLYSPAADLTAPSVMDEQVSKTDYPVHLEIPRLGIDTTVDKVGITASGKMAVPLSYTKVGWYKYGAVPGETGVAVLAGHVDDGLALPGVFSRLSELQIGDDIFVTNNTGQHLHFVMTGSQAYDKDAATEDIFQEKSRTLLRLITCTGSWLPDQQTHDQRLVVTAELEQ